MEGGPPSIIFDSIYSYYSQPFPFVRVPKALQNDALAKTDNQNSEFIPDLAEPIKSGPSTFKIVSTPLVKFTHGNGNQGKKSKNEGDRVRKFVAVIVRSVLRKCMLL